MNIPNIFLDTPLKHCICGANPAFYRIKIDKMKNTFKPEAIIIGGGIAGLTAGMEITNAGKKVLLLEQ